MHELIESPLWRPEDLGRPIPNSPHAVSVCLPTWRDNVGYEENEPRVHSRLTTGYPRFVYNRFCRELFALCERRFARPGEACLAFPSAGAAERFRAWLRDHTGASARIDDFGACGVHAVTFPLPHAAVAKAGWQHCGEGVTSRRAAACLSHEAGGSPGDEPRAPELPPEGDAPGDVVRRRLARVAGVPAEDVFLFPCGMSAIYALHRAIGTLLPGRKSVQFGFPYVDTLKIQEKCGPGAHFFPKGDAADLAALEARLEREPVSALYAEFPSNPLLASPDLERLAAVARRRECPLVVDDTLAMLTNAALLPPADVLCTSLTKFFSGAGDVTAGALVLNRAGPFHSRLHAALHREEDLLWEADARVLERNSRDFEERMRGINARAEVLADFLRSHPRVARVYYPKFESPAEYRAFQRPGGGWGGLLSLALHDANAAPRFFDALRVSKGPNLGTNYTLACPYTILAHYRELDFAESCGVSRSLVRVSVGLEDPEDLIARFDAALGA